MEGRNTSNHYVEITVTSQEDANFRVFIGKSSQPAYTASVKANSTTRIRLDYRMVEPTGSERIQEMGIYLVADRKVNVYALNHDNNSSDVAVIYPVESLGTEYLTMCYKPHLDTTRPEHGRNSEFVIVASQENTKVTITPTQTTDGSHAANVPFTITLGKGELYQVQAVRDDLTGSHIVSDKPVAVYAGSLSTTIPFEATGGWDHMYEQMPPVNTWGREYYTVPLLTRSKDYFRIMASQDSTRVTIGTGSVYLNRGRFYEFTLNTPARIFADKQILVSQYSQSRNNDNVTNGDGFMIILSPVSQAKKDVTFEAYTSTIIKVYFVNIVVPSSEAGKIELDGNLIGNFSPFTDDLRYSYAQVPISSGTHRLRNLNPDGGFIAYVYAFGGNEAYGYGVGFNLSLLLDLSEGLEKWLNLSEKGDTLAICRGESVKLDAGPYFDTYKWKNGVTERAIAVSEQSWYQVTASTIDGCIQSDSIYLLVNDPRPDIGRDLSGCPPFSKTLDAGDGFVRYSWNTGATTRKIIVDSTGLYSVKVFDKFGCQAADTMNFTVFPVPNATITGEKLICGSKSGEIEVKLTGTSDSVWQKGVVEWTTSQPGIFAFEQLGMTSAGFSVAKWGKFEIKYTLRTADGCIATDTFRTALFQTPTSNIETADPGKCGEYNRKIIYTGNASPDATLHWDFGGLGLIGEPDWKSRLVSLGAVNSNPYVSLFVEENGCISDTSRIPVGAYPDFTMDTRKSRGCDSAEISFTGKLNVPDNQLQFEWNFGDGSANSTSMEQNPVHLYSKPGYYDVSLKITNRITGCQIGFTIGDMVKIFQTPVAGISTDPAFCYGDTIQVIYPSNIDSSQCFWYFEGAHQAGNGNDSILVVAEKPVAVIRLIVDEYGCKSQPVETTVKRKPVFDFIADTLQGCQPMTLKVTAVTRDGLIDFTWMKDSLVLEGEKSQFSLPRDGTHSFTLAAHSLETGCRDTVVKNDWIRVHPKPVAAFDVNFPVAILGQSELSFTNKSILAEDFRWDFGDGQFSDAKNPVHRFTDLGEYPVILFAESDFGCRDTTEMMVRILPFDVATPNAFRPESPIAGNRVFMPFTIGVDPRKFHMMIFNRWGQQVFETRDPGYPWDGTLKNGAKAPAGNYVWKAVYTDIQGFVHERLGQVVLIR